MKITKTAAAPEGADILTQTISVEPPAPAYEAHDHASSSFVQGVIFVGVLAALCAWAAVEVLRKGFDGYAKAKKKASPWYRDALLRLVSAVCGGVAGWLLFHPVGCEGDQYLGLLAGVAGGGLATVVVYAIKRRIRGKA